ncbi:MAG TPA: hypothetical protein VES39_03825 [Rhodospirillales bacterium]|nr:hypothetical protein [Rhodospirillales bacterium]
MVRTTALLLSALLLFGCSSPSSTRYSSADVGRSIETSPGSVVSSRIVRVGGDRSAVGPIAGGALGGAGAGWGFQSGWAAIIGAVIGAGAGYLAQDAASGGEGIEYLVQMDDGRTITLVQNRESGEMPIGSGTPVLVQLGGTYSRVVVDPRGGSRTPAAGSGGSWADPDKLGAPGAAPSSPPGPPTAPAASGTGQAAETAPAPTIGRAAQ